MLTTSSDSTTVAPAVRSTVLEVRAGPGHLNAAVVFWVDILLVCVVGLLFVLTLPRIVASFGQGGGWTQGLFLRTFLFNCDHLRLTDTYLFTRTRIPTLAIRNTVGVFEAHASPTVCHHNGQQRE